MIWLDKGKTLPPYWQVEVEVYILSTWSSLTPGVDYYYYIVLVILAFCMVSSNICLGEVQVSYYCSFMTFIDVGEVWVMLGDPGQW